MRFRDFLRARSQGATSSCRGDGRPDHRRFAPVRLARIALVLPVALFAPGYVLQRLWWERDSLGPVAGAALSGLLSVAVFSLLGLLLAAVGVEITVDSMLIAADALLLLSVLGIALRTARAAAAQLKPGCAPIAQDCVRVRAAGAHDRRVGRARHAAA